MDYLTIDNLIKPAVAGGVAALAFRQFFGDAQVSVMGRQTSIVLAGFAFGAASTLITETASMFILPHISKDVRLRHFESLALTLGTSGAVFWALPRFLIDGAENNTPQTAQQMVMTGVLAEIVSQWIFESFFSGENSIFLL